MEALSLFSGMGGLCEGLRQAGFSLEAAVDDSRFVSPNYRINFPDTPFFEEDVRGLLEDGWAGSRGLDLDDIDLLAGGPPCQGVSQIGPRQLDDERNDLFGVFIQIADRFTPKAVLMENVPNIHKLADGYFDQRVVSGFRDIGYSNITRLNLHADEFGVPQARERAFYFATRDDLSVGYELTQLVRSLAGSMKTDRPVSVWEAISDLPPRVVESEETLPYPPCEHPSGYQKEMRLDHDGQVYSKTAKMQRGIKNRDPKQLYNHHTKDIGEKRLQRIRHLEPGDNANSIPDELWNGARAEKYRRLPLDRPSHTLLAQMHRDLSEWVHPKEDRWITVREAMRIQSFHDGFVLGVSEWRQLQQIGNSVPPLLGKVVGDISRTLIEHATGADIELPEGFQVQPTLSSY